MDDALQAPVDPLLEALRDILVQHLRQRIEELESELGSLDRRVTNRDTLIATIAPILGGAIRRQLRDAREEMIEALYPIIGQLVVRAVSEAVRDLARTVDARVRTSFNPRILWWRVRARLGGASSAETALRASLPFEVTEVFVIHRETGLLLRHIPAEGAASPDSDIISGMLTAIRDFAQDAFGSGSDAQLEEIEYGDRHILIEAAQHVYMAVVVEGTEPPGFRAAMRERLINLQGAHAETVQQYDGDPSPLADIEEPMREWMAGARPRTLGRTQKWALTAASAVTVICLLGACLAGRWAWQSAFATPSPVPVAVQATTTHTPTPSLTPTLQPSDTPDPSPTPLPTSSPTLSPSDTPTPHPTSMPTATPTITPEPSPAIVAGLMTGHVWLRAEPAQDAARLGLVVQRGQEVEILAVHAGWVRIRWSPHSQLEAIGWVPLRWVGTIGPIPSRLITPTVTP